MKQAFSRLLVLCVCLLALASCARGPGAPLQGGEIADLRTIPQDLTAFVGRDGDCPLMDEAERTANYERWRTRFFAPWDMAKPSIARKDVQTLLKRKARGYKGVEPWGEAEWRRMADNGDGASYPNMAAHGITVRAANLREMPTRLPRFTEPTPDPRANPFDYFQYSSLHQGTPVFICQRSKDGRWYYVETPLAGGWLEAIDIMETTPAFEALYRSLPLAVVTRERAALGERVKADIGCVLPLSGDHVMLPCRVSGELRLTPAVPEEGAVQPMPMLMTKAAVAALGNAMIGQPYGWGGMLGLRDCSATTRDLMTPFGIWLPRNSGAQGRTGAPIDISGLYVDDKERLVLTEAVPFASLVVMKGHVVLYVGRWRDRAAIVHNLWGIRVQGAPGSDRLVIGRTVVTSMTPGAELSTLADGKTIGDRFHTVTILGNARD